MRIPVNQPYSTAQSIPFGAPDPAAYFKKHSGIDYALPTAREVYAPASGVVTPYKWGLYHGTVVEIWTGQDYPHMFHNSKLLVSPGQHVTEGQLVALSGATGQGITGPHVHFGVSKVSIPQVTKFADFINPNEWLKGGAMQPASYTEARIYSQELLFRDMGEDEFNKYHKGKNRNQLFDDMRNAPEREAYLADLTKWKAIGVDAKPYKDAVVASKAWNTDMKGSVNNVLPVIDDLWQYKKDTPPGGVKPIVLKPGDYRVESN